MFGDGSLGLFVGATVIGLVHGAEPGHGWPIAATYALERKRTWASGILASSLLGIGHLISSIAVVIVFFLAKDYFNLTQIGWVRYVAGVLLIGLGIREYLGGGHSHGSEDEDTHEGTNAPAHAHNGGHDDFAVGMAPRTASDHTHDHDHSHGGHNHGHHHEGHSHGGHDHSHHDHSEDAGWLSKLKSLLPFSGHSHDHAHFEETDSADLMGLVSTAFVLGFVHEEEFEIIGLCLGSSQCLELMLVYALAVIVGLVGLTMLLLAGYTHYEERVEEYTEYFPTISAAVLILMGIGFIVGVF